MFDKIYNGSFKPMSEDKLINLLSDDEINVLGENLNKLGLKYSVLLYLNNIDIELIKCPVCGNYISFKTFKRNVFPACCSKKCSGVFNKDKVKFGIIKRFGSIENKNEYVKNKQKENSLKKYGMNFQSTQEFKNKVKNTLLEKYGVDHNSKIHEVKEKRYVVENGKKISVLHTHKAKENRKKSVENRSKDYSNEIGKKISNGIKKHYSYIDRNSLNNGFGNSIQSLALQSNCSMMTAYRSLKNQNLISKSYTESEISEYIKSLGFDVVTNTRKVIFPKELDIYVESKKLAIEYDGLYWHSSNSKENDKKYKNKHLEKTEMCEKLGIQLLHIFENEWLDPIKKNIWKSVISHKLNLSKTIFARKCILKHIDHKTAFDFCEKNHLQGGIFGFKYLGLFFENKLVQVAIFGKSRYSNIEKIELLRLCSLNYHCVVGGASKITKNMKFVSYGNRRWCSSLSNVYDKLGSHESVSNPCYFYVKGNELKHRSNFMKHKLKNKLDIFDPHLSEAENCYNNGFRRIWDCGNLIYKV